NNAGITRDTALARMRREQWDEVIATNLGSMFNATQPLVLQLVKQRNGSIINITSLAGVYGSNGQSNYAASKAGVIGFTKALSKELAAFRVRVNAVAPGLIETDMLSAVGEERLKSVKSQIPDQPTRAASFFIRLTRAAVFREGIGYLNRSSIF